MKISTFVSNWIFQLLIAYFTFSPMNSALFNTYFLFAWIFHQDNLSFSFNEKPPPTQCVERGELKGSRPGHFFLFFVFVIWPFEYEKSFSLWKFNGKCFSRVWVLIAKGKKGMNMSYNNFDLQIYVFAHIFFIDVWHHIFPGKTLTLSLSFHFATAVSPWVYLRRDLLLFFPWWW